MPPALSAPPLLSALPSPPTTADPRLGDRDSSCRGFRARVYGLNVRANRAIPGLLTTPDQDETSADVSVMLQEPAPWAPSGARPRYRHGTTDDHGVPLVQCDEAGSGRYILRYADGTRFFIDQPAATIWSDWPAPLTLEDAATYLLGPVLGFYLRLLGHVCLHASTVVVAERAFAFVGPAGAGKSTLAAAFAALGDAVLSEDVSCLDLVDGEFRVRAGYPLIRLWEHSTRLLAAEGLPLLTPNWTKRYLALDQTRLRFRAEPAKLAGVLLLQQRRPLHGPAQLGDLGGQDLVAQLVANTYTNYLLDREMRAREFRLLGRLASVVPARALTLSADGSRLREACEWLKRHAFA